MYYYMVVGTQNGGSYVLAVDAGREAILSVWQWQWGHLLGKVAVSCSPPTSRMRQRHDHTS